MSMMMGSRGGKNTTNMYGVNGNTELDSGKMKINGSYNFVGNNSETETKRLRQTFMPDTAFIYNQNAKGNKRQQIQQFLGNTGLGT